MAMGAASRVVPRERRLSGKPRQSMGSENRSGNIDDGRHRRRSMGDEPSCEVTLGSAPRPWSKIVANGPSPRIAAVPVAAASGALPQHNLGAPTASDRIHEDSTLGPTALRCRTTTCQAPQAPVTPRQAGGTVSIAAREENVRLREANVQLKEQHLAGRQELEAIDRARKAALEEIEQARLTAQRELEDLERARQGAHRELVQLQEQCEEHAERVAAEERKLEQLRANQAVMKEKVERCREVVARTVSSMDLLHQHRLNGAPEAGDAVAEPADQSEEAVEARVIAAGQEAERLLASLEAEEREEVAMSTSAPPPPTHTSVVGPSGQPRSALSAIH